MDNSKMAKKDAKIDIDLWKGDHGFPKASHEVETRKHWCGCGYECECTCKPSFDEAINPPGDDGLIDCCCPKG